MRCAVRSAVVDVRAILLEWRGLTCSIETCPAPHWPAHGEENLYNVVVSYAPGLPAVLKGVSVIIERSEKVGAAGRTGAGKSTLVMAFSALLT
jgi:ABC-type multidrug transport system fused ATPase/permease subunit